MRDILLLFSTPLLMLIFAATFIVLWDRDRTRMENCALAIGWALMGVGFLISLLRPESWGRMTVAVTHVPYTLSAVAISWGVLTRIGIKPPVKAQLWIAVAGFGVLMLSQNIGNSVVADIYITNLTCGVMMVLTTQLFAQGGKRDAVERSVLAMLVITSAQFFVRPVVAIMVDDPIVGESYRDTIYYLSFYWMFAFGSVLFGLAQIAGAVKDQLQTIRHDSSTDDLSGLLLRGEFETQVEAALAKATAEECSVSLIICDMDHFKKVNDIWGHQIGDQAISAFGGMISGMIRDTDIVGRIGGEEFCVLVWNADQMIASSLAERLRHATTNLSIDAGSLDVRLSASFGVAERSQAEAYRSLFARADKALYRAKSNGRNQVSTADQVVLDEMAEAGAMPPETSASEAA